MVPLFDTTAPHAPSQHKEAGQTETVESLIRRAHTALEAAGLRVSPSKVSARIRAQVRKRGIESAERMIASYSARSSGHGSFDAFCLTYADPTGETAVRNLMAASR